MKQLLCLLTLIAIVTATPARGMTIDEAYRAIPHKRTSYDAHLSTLGAAEREFLARLFALSDEALVERVKALAALRKGNRTQLERYEVQVSRIISTLRALPEPASTHGLAVALSQAIHYQRAFFQAAFSSSEQDRQIGNDPNVLMASHELRRLYTDLMTRYSAEHPHNRDAFYQHLCALDFL